MYSGMKTFSQVVLEVLADVQDNATQATIRNAVRKVLILDGAEPSKLMIDECVHAVNQEITWRVLNGRSFTQPK